ncbi:MAG: HAD-IIA family hydrolase [Candidatus Heimdallarchaeota archaeon]
MINKTNKNLENIKGILSDIDGTLYFKGSVIPGVIDAISKLRKMRLKFLFLTNTDSRSPKTIHTQLVNFGFSIKENEIFTPINALKEFLSIQSEKSIYLVASKEIESLFHEFNLIKGDQVPDYVIISDFRDNWDLNRLNTAFKYLMKGAKLFGTQGNRYFLDQKGEPVIDTGSLVKMLAETARIPYKIFGKPSTEFFSQALTKLKLKSNECIVIGDDFESDIKGANNANIKSILVKTGKGFHFKPSNNEKEPFLIIESFESLLEYL